VLLAYAIYSAKWLSAKRIRNFFYPVHILLSRKYLFDEFYEGIIVKKILYDGLFAGFKWFDTFIIDGLVNGIARVLMAVVFVGFRSFDVLILDGLVNNIGAIVSNLGRVLRKVQTGQPQLYGIFIILGILAIGLCLIFSG